MKLLLSKARWRSPDGIDHATGVGAPTHYAYMIIELDENGTGELHDRVTLPADVHIISVMP